MSLDFNFLFWKYCSIHLSCSDLKIRVESESSCIPFGTVHTTVYFTDHFTYMLHNYKHSKQKSGSIGSFNIITEYQFPHSCSAIVNTNKQAQLKNHQVRGHSLDCVRVGDILAEGIQLMIIPIFTYTCIEYIFITV
jgi:hypothetical protein